MLDFETEEFIKQAGAVMHAMEPVMEGYPRLVVVIACARTIAAMLGPTNVETREDFLAQFPGYMRSMWKMMDEIVAQHGKATKQ